MSMITSSLMAVGALLSAQSTSTLSLDRALALAEANAFDVLIQRTTVESQRQRLMQAKAALNPRLGLNTVYTRFDKENVASIGPGQSFVTQPLNSTNVTASLTYDIDIAGSARKQIDAQRRTLTAQEYGVQAILNELRLSVKSSYVTVLRAQGQVKVAEQALELSKARRDQAKRQFEADSAAQVDLTRFDAQVSQAEADLVSAKNSLANAKNGLNQVLSRPIETESELEVLTVDVPTLASPDALVDLAVKSRPDVKRTETTILALKDVRRSEETGDDPTLNFNMSHQRNLNATGLNPRTFQTTSTFTLSIPIFDQGITRSRVKAARQDEASAKIQLDQLKLNVSQQVRNALNDYNTASARLKNGLDQERLAEEVYRISVVRRDAGEGTYVEVVDSINQLTQARNNVVNSRYDTLLAYFQLQRAIGKDRFDATEAATPAPLSGQTTLVREESK